MGLENEASNHESESDSEPPLTIEEKLAQAQREAEEAAAALKTALKQGPALDKHLEPKNRRSSPKRSLERNPLKPQERRTAQRNGSAKADIEKKKAVPVSAATTDESKKPVKRTKAPLKVGAAAGVRRSKRRSTLSPEELEGLIGV
jgi:hypothetical protein